MKYQAKFIFMVSSCSCFLEITSFCSAPRLSLATRRSSRTSVEVQLFMSSFFGKFDEDDFIEDEDDDDDDYADLPEVDVANFRNRMSGMLGQSEEGFSSSTVDDLLSFATSKDSVASKEWAYPAERLAPGTLLLANPSKFCGEFAGKKSTPSPALLSKFGLTLPPPADLGPDRRADLLPVLLVVQEVERLGYRAVLLNRRTGYLLGDLEQSSEEGSSMQAPLLEKFCIQPLWFGGIDNVSTGLDMLHLCPAVIGAQKLTEDGLFWGGDPAQAQDAMSDSSLERVMTGFDFKFFVQNTLFAPGQLEKHIQDGTFVLATASTHVLFKSRDRMGTRRAKPLWTEVMELLGGKYACIKDQLYNENDLS
jgi:hypothetical protein